MPAGLYLHVPFCRSKCPYCDFYSFVPSDDGLLDAYVDGMLSAMERRQSGIPFDTLYFGGGTPSLLGGERLARLIAGARKHFSFAADSEITLEANPADDLYNTLAAFAAAGGNRLSLGMQAATEGELARLGRRHHTADVERAVADARRAGIGNISLDLMLGTPGQSDRTALAAVERAASLGATHLSAYMLKLEPDTPFGKHPPEGLADEEALADRYLAVCAAAEAAGFRQYEISNFARPGFESRHNSKYWDLSPYLGLGPAAASFWEGRRFHFSRDLAAFLAGAAPEEEEDAVIPAGSREEYLCLRLRTAEGLTEAGFSARYGAPIPAAWRKTAEGLPHRLVLCDEEGIRLTREGFLVSNAVIAAFL